MSNENTAIAPTEGIVKTAQVFAGSGKESLSDLFKISASPSDISILRGFHDRRGLALSLHNEKSLSSTAPKKQKALLAWISFLDAYGELRANWHGLDGAFANARAARSSILERIFPISQYDSASAIIAWDFLRSTISNFDERLPDVAEKLTPELVEWARNRSPLHMIMSERLKRDGDLLQAVMDDPAAFNYRAALLIAKAPEEDELQIPFINLNIPKELKHNGFSSPKDYLEQERKLINLKGELGKARQQKLDYVYSQLRGSRSDRKKHKKNIKRNAGRLFDPIISEAQKNVHQLERGLEKFKKWKIAEEAALRKRIKEDYPDEKTANQPSQPIEQGNSFSYYRIAREAKDEIVNSSNLIAPEKSREILEGLYSSFAVEFRKANSIGRKMRSHIMAPREVRIERDQHEGILYGDLTRIVTDPYYDTPYIQRHEKYGQDLDTTVTLLLDNSVSMTQNNKRDLTFISADRLSYWISNAGIPTEILGFTTRNVGIQGSTGRRDSLLHVIYKNPYEPHSQAITQNMAAMLQDSISGGTVLGEAVCWAHNRIIRARNVRKILMVLTDGEPSVTYGGEGKYNAAQDHLRDTVKWIERRSSVEIIGIGIKTNVEKYFSNAIEINSPYELLDTITTKLKAVIDTSYQSDPRVSRRPAFIPTPKFS